MTTCIYIYVYLEIYIVEIWKILDWVRFCERAPLHKHPSHRYTTHVSHEKKYPIGRLKARWLLDHLTLAEPKPDPAKQGVEHPTGNTNGKYRGNID